MSVVVSFEEVGPCQRRLTIEIPAPAVAAETGRVIQEYRRGVSLPGFRKGKAPQSIVRQRFQREIDKEVKERLIPRYWHQAEAEKNLEPLLPPRIEDLRMADGEPMTFTALVETRPDIEIGDPGEFELPQFETEPSDDEVDNALTDLRRQLASWVESERPAALGDLVVGQSIRIDLEEETEPVPIQLELGAEGVDEETNLALTGLMAGKSTEITRSVGEGADAEERRYRIEVTAVKERDLPELDDALAAQVGDFETVAELRDAVRSDLQAHKERELRHKREVALLDQLRERYPVELPVGVVEQEVEHLVEEYAQGLANHGVDVANVQIDWEKVGREMQPRAQKRVHARLVLDAVAKADGSRLNEREFESVLGRLAAQRGTSAFALRQHLSESGRLDALRQQLLREQVIRHLLGEKADDETKASAEA